jgi:hypothetical protein
MVRLLVYIDGVMVRLLVYIDGVMVRLLVYIDGVMVRLLVSSTIDRGFKPQSDQTED